MRTAARRWSFRAAIVLALLVTTALLTFSTAFADASGQPSGITDQARDMHDLYIIVLIVALVVFFPVEGALVYIIFKYRKKGDALPVQTHGNNYVEILWTSIPIVIVLILFVFSFNVLRDVDKSAKKEDLTVAIEGFQFCWAAKYTMNDLGRGGDPNATGDVQVLEPNCEAKQPVIKIPVNEPVEFTLESNDVIHSFYVRDFLYKLDVIPGRDNKFQVTAREIGVFEGQCAELCGINHATMRFKIEVVSRADFDKFIADLAAAKTNAAAAAK